MGSYVNHAKQRLAGGEIAVGLGVQHARTVDIAAIGKACGYDWLFLDMEHSTMDLGTAAQIAAAALPLGISPLVRVPGREHYHASRLIEAGAQGVVAPHIETPEEARELVATCKYPPIGLRSSYGPQPQFGFQPSKADEVAAEVNAQTLVVVMLESPRAIASVDSIAAVEGVDVVMIGTNDLCAEMGIAGQLGDPKVGEAYGKVIDACAKHHKVPGMGGVTDKALLEKYVGMGMRFILAGNDYWFMMNAARERAAFLKAIPAGPTNHRS